MPPAAAWRVLKRHGLNRLAWIDKPTGRAAHRISRKQPHTHRQLASTQRWHGRARRETTACLGDFCDAVRSCSLAGERGLIAEGGVQKLRTLADICKKHDLDLDESLIAVWDAGFDDIDDPDARIPPKTLHRLLQRLDIESAKEQTKVAYWQQRLEMTRDEFARELDSLGVTLRPEMVKLPKGALKKLRKKYADAPPREETIDAPHEAIPAFVWHRVGNQPPISYLEEEDIIAIHQALVSDFANDKDPIAPPGVKEPGLIGSAVNRPRTSFGDELKYPTIEMAAAALMHSVVHNHCFFNGNKRTALVAMLTFLDHNSFIATCDEKELFRFTLNLARHNLVPSYYDNLPDREVLVAAQWIRAHSRAVEKGERPIPWLRLKRILNGYGCEFSTPSRGNRLNITRTVDAPQRRRRRQQQRTLRIQVQHAGDGQEVARNTISDIRRELELDEAHDVDSAAFYEAKALPDDFVKTYAKTLKRLGRI